MKNIWKAKIFRHHSWVLSNWILRKGMHCHLVSKDVRWMKAFLFAQESTKCSVFLISCQATERPAKMNVFVFRSRFCISVIMRQHFIPSFFVLAPTHNVNVWVTVLLPAPSSTQPKHCFDQVLKCAGGALAPVDMLQHPQGCWALDVVLGKRGQIPCLIFRKSHTNSGLALKGWDTMATLLFQENSKTFWFKEEKINNSCLEAASGRPRDSACARNVHHLLAFLKRPFPQICHKSSYNGVKAVFLRFLYLWSVFQNMDSGQTQLKFPILGSFPT